MANSAQEKEDKMDLLLKRVTEMQAQNEALARHLNSQTQITLDNKEKVELMEKQLSTFPAVVVGGVEKSLSNRLQTEKNQNDWKPIIQKNLPGLLKTSGKYVSSDPNFVIKCLNGLRFVTTHPSYFIFPFSSHVFYRF